MKVISKLLVLLLISFGSLAQRKEAKIKGIYFQWGYNREWYTKSNVHIDMSNGNHFTLHKAYAVDKPDFDAVYKKPLEVSIPQYNYRLGFYINKTHTKSIEINFDHIKYVLPSDEKVRVTGVIDGQKIDGDSVLNSVDFMHLEHTDGGNLLHINYAAQKVLAFTQNRKRPLVNLIYKAGAGINIPRTDFTWKGDRMNNDFHVAGYNIGVEGGARYYPFNHFFIESTCKTGYVRYINALANTTQLKGNRVHHGFGYFEVIGLIGYDFIF